ncbi:MAG: sigma 54-interacting transcriptional regulator [Bacillota bacterium]
MVIPDIDPVRQIYAAITASITSLSPVSSMVIMDLIKVVWNHPTFPAIFVDSGNTITQANPAAKALLHETGRAPLGETLHSLFPDFSRQGSLERPGKGCFYTTVRGHRLRITFAEGKRETCAIIEVLGASKTTPLSFAEGMCEAMEEILALSYDLVTVTDGHGTGVRATSRMEELFGVPKQDFIGRNVKDLVDNRVLSRSVTLAVLDTGSPRTLVQRTKSNHLLVVTGIPVWDAAGRISRVVNFSRDISSPEQLRRRIAEAQVLLDNYRFEAFERQHLPSCLGKASWQKAIDRAAAVDSTVLITGESGTGKEVAAREIHQKSTRARAPFIKINCAAIPETLFESELFGYERGAFTGASVRKEGLIQRAEGGTLLLDEIAEIPPFVQVKLLHILQDREFIPVGGRLPLKANVRIIASTNQDLRRLVEENAFRKDLFYRLNVLRLDIPPLRERLDEMPGLVRTFLERFNSRLNRSVTLSEDARKLLKAHQWPGNIRELENLVERLVVMSDTNLVTASQVNQMLHGDSDTPAISVKQVVPLREAIEIVERQLLKKAMEAGHSTRSASALLGINQSTVVRKLRRYGMSP